MRIREWYLTRARREVPECDGLGRVQCSDEKPCDQHDAMADLIEAASDLLFYVKHKFQAEISEFRGTPWGDGAKAVLEKAVRLFEAPE